MSKANQKIYKQGETPESITHREKTENDNDELKAINRVGIQANRYRGVKE